ncbi:cytochrome P450 [Paraphaeosphaeria sporulosa]
MPSRTIINTCHRFTGSDTTATSIYVLVLYVTSNPLVYSKLTQEIREADRTGTITSPYGEQQLSQLPYLQACIKEGLRVFPPITTLRERIVPEGGDTMQGHYLPVGTYIGLNLPGLLTNEAFGQDPKIFRPERWLDATPEQLKAMIQVHELMFN